MIERRVLRLENETLGGLELPSFAAQGASAGPRLALIAGIHGCEYSSIAAVVRFMRTLDTSRLRGSIIAVPIVNTPAFWARSAFVTPQDGENLNRSFPGSYTGTFSAVLARSVFDQVIAGADVLIDLHGGDQVEALEPFTLYDESRVEDRARELALAFGFPYVVRNPRGDAPISGMTSTAAAAEGITAVIAEAGGRGLLEEDAVRLHLVGLERALQHLGMLPGEPCRPSAGVRRVEAFVWLRSTSEGWWDPVVEAGAEVEGGSLLGVVRDLYGDAVEEIVAPQRGVVLFLTTSPAVSTDGLLLGLGTEPGPI